MLRKTADVAFDPGCPAVVGGTQCTTVYDAPTAPPYSDPPADPDQTPMYPPTPAPKLPDDTCPSGWKMKTAYICVPAPQLPGQSETGNEGMLLCQWKAWCERMDP